MTKVEKAKAYIKTNGAKSYKDIQGALGCSRETVRIALTELGVSAGKGCTTPDSVIENIQAYQTKNPQCTAKHIMETLCVTQAAVTRARKLMGHKKSSSMNSPEAVAAEEYCMAATHKVTARELQEKFGLRRYVAVQVSSWFTDEAEAQPTQNQPLNETDYGPNWDHRRFDALRVPWNRVAEVLGATA